MTYTLGLALLGCSQDATIDPPPVPPVEADTDTDTDADADADTDADVDTDDSCVEVDLGTGTDVFGGADTSGADDDELPSCASSAGADVVFGFTAPVAGRYRFDPSGSVGAPVLAVRAGCAEAELACAAGVVSLELDAGRFVTVVADDAGTPGDVQLSVQLVPPTEAGCGDGLDDDFDGAADCLDADCAAADRCVCPTEGELTDALVGTTAGAADTAATSCAAATGPDATAAFVAPRDGRYGFRLDPAETVADASLAITAGCGGVELGCAAAPGELLVVDLVAGEQAIAVIDGPPGPHRLDVTEIPTSEVGCADGLDEDLDQHPDCSDDDCVPDPACAEVCDDGVDDNGNGLTDCADGAYCPATGACEVRCPAIQLVGPGQIERTTLGRADVGAPTCGVGDPAAPDDTVAFVPLVQGEYTVRFTPITAGFTPVVSTGGGCGAPETTCDAALEPDGSLVLTRTLGAGELTTFLVSGDTDVAGAYTLDIEQHEVVCRDGVDDDGDGSLDCFDDDCATAVECAEDCDDGIDDNGDLMVDCQDVRCATLPECADVCPEATVIGTPAVVRGSTLGQGDDYALTTCAGGLGPDAAIQFTPTDTAMYSFSTAGTAFDTVVYVLTGCDGTTRTCNDDASAGVLTSNAIVSLDRDVPVTVVVDGFDAFDRGDFVLTITRIEL